MRGCIRKKLAKKDCWVNNYKKGYNKFKCNSHNYLIRLIYNRKYKLNARLAKEREVILFYFKFMSDNIAGISSTIHGKAGNQRKNVKSKFQFMLIISAFYTCLSQDFIYLQQSRSSG